MSDLPADWHDRIDLRAELARIDRDRAETAKLFAERDKFRREPWMALTLALAALLGTLLGSVPMLLTLLAKGVP